jgi:hypothetical protein
MSKYDTGTLRKELRLKARNEDKNVLVFYLEL